MVIMGDKKWEECVGTCIRSVVSFPFQPGWLQPIPSELQSRESLAKGQTCDKYSIHVWQMDE